MNKIESVVSQTRPSSLDEIVGMQQNKELLHYDIKGSLKLNKPLPSYLVIGPAGTGKTTIANIIGTLADSKVIKLLGSEIKSETDLYDLAANPEIKDRDVIFLEEAHTIGGSGRKSKICQAVLLEWIENHKLLNQDYLGVSGDPPKVSFVLPTTNPGKLTPALRSRCRVLHTSYYSIEEMCEILRRAMAILNIFYEDHLEALHLLARCSRGTPRIAIMQRLDTLCNYMAVENKTFCYETVVDYLKRFHIHEWGLERNDMIYCRRLYDKMLLTNGRPVAQNTLEKLTGFEPDYLNYVIESYLIQIGVISIEGRGRVLTDFGSEILGKPKISASKKLNFMNRGANIDKDRLRQLLQEEEICKGGMKRLAPMLNLTYGQDNDILRKALRDLGYDSKRKVGIIKCH